MPRSARSPELVRHSRDLASMLERELADGRRVAGVQLQLIQLGLLAIAFEKELLVAEERVVGDTVRIHLERFAALRPRQVPGSRTHRESIGLFRTGLE